MGSEGNITPQSLGNYVIRETTPSTPSGISIIFDILFFFAASE
jgi:hypothetical protein